MEGPLPTVTMMPASTRSLILAWAVRLGMSRTSEASEEVICPMVARKVEEAELIFVEVDLGFAFGGGKDEGHNLVFDVVGFGEEGGV